LIGCVVLQVMFQCVSMPNSNSQRELFNVLSYIIWSYSGNAINLNLRKSSNSQCKYVLYTFLYHMELKQYCN